MVAKLAPSTSLNTLGSLVYCCLVLVAHSYASYLAVLRYQEAHARAWPGGSAKPGAVGAYLALLVLSLVCLPLFAITAVLRVGNYAGDGTKLGRDHALNSNVDVVCRKRKQSVFGVKLRVMLMQHLCVMRLRLKVFVNFWIVRLKDIAHWLAVVMVMRVLRQRYL